MMQKTTEMQSYLKQPDLKSRRELIQSALNYFWELKEKHISQEKAKQIVLDKTGVIL